MTRELSTDEIDDILSFLKPNPFLPIETALSIISNLKERYSKQLKNCKVNPKIIPELKKQIEREHQKSLIDPGESIGILAAQSIGEKNTQSTLNSIEWNEKILYSEKGAIKIEPIGKTIDNLLFKHGDKVERIEENRTEYLQLEEGYFIPSCDEKGFSNWYKIEAVTRHLPIGKLVKVTTKSGREVTATQSKSFLVWNEEKQIFDAVAGCDVKVGDILPTTSYLPRLSGKTIQNIKNDEKDIKLDRDFGFLIGVYLRFDSDVHEMNSIQDFFDVITGSRTKLPDFCYNAPEDFIQGLLSGFFKDIKDYKYTFVSEVSYFEDIIKGILFLLTYYGIFGEFIKGEDEIIYKLLIDYRNRKKLEQIIEPLYSSKCNITNSWFDEIKFIEFVDGSTEYVYDLTVAETRNFQLFNGLNIRDTFHKTGQSDKTVTQGVPRFQELLNGSRNTKSVNCKIYFKEGNKTIQELRNIINYQIVSLKLKDISSSIKIVMKKPRERWYDIYKILYNDKFEKYEDCISIKLNKKMLFKYRIHIEDIVNVLEKSYDDLACVFSSEDIAQLDIFIDVSKIKFPHDKLLYITMDNAPEVYIEEVVLPILEKLELFGVPGISAIYYNLDEKKQRWYVETDGTNFRKLLGHPIIEMETLFSNNVWDIYLTLGIEAAREMLINEFISVMEGINTCHVKLLVDKMTYRGTISSISRYTLRTDEAGVYSKISFEETLGNFISSAFAGDVENTNGVSASIICGKRSRCGTGMIDLKMDLKNLPKV